MVRKYIRAGEIAERVKARVELVVKPGSRILDIVTSLENYILELGGKPAFPVNVSINNEAAHRTAYVDDDGLIPEDGVVKVDIGVHVDGYIADTAVSIPLSERYLELVEATREALERALKNVRPGIRVSEVGSVVEKVIRSRGFKVIKNLSGHSLAEYTIHAGETIPNFRDPLNLSRFRPGTAYAIEPFATTGRGVVSSERRVTIYAVKSPTRCEEGLEQHMVEEIYRRFKTLPFSERWLQDLISRIGLWKLREQLNYLSKSGCIISYPVLSDILSSYVAQFEDTVLVLDDRSIIVTTNRSILQ